MDTNIVMDNLSPSFCLLSFFFVTLLLLSPQNVKRQHISIGNQKESSKKGLGIAW